MCLLTQSESGTSGGPMAHGIRGVSAWCSEECPRGTRDGRQRTQRLCGTMVLVQDGIGTDICNSTYACVKQYFNLLVFWCIHVLGA